MSQQFDGAGNATLAFFAGRRTELQDATGRRSAWYYTPLGRPYAEVRDFGYDPDGTPRLNLVTRHTYDGQARLATTTQPEGNVVAYTYSPDQFQNLVAVVETPKPGSPLPARTSSFTYEPDWNRVSSTTDVRGTVTTYEYDWRGNAVRVAADVNGLNLVSFLTHDGFGRVLSATDPTGTVTQYTYDESGNPTSIVADAGPGRLNLTTTFVHDAVGNMVARTDPRGSTTTMEYDAARRLLSTTAPAPFDLGSNLVRTTNAYDPDGRLVEVVRSDGTAGAGQVTRTEYTATGQVLATTDPNGNRTSFAYDAAERLQEVALPATVGRRTRYAYDGAGRLAQVIDNTGVVAEAYAYTPNSRRASFTNGRGATTDYAYDGFDRLSQTLYPLGSTGTRTAEGFTWDAGDNLLTRTTRAGAVIGFAYDGLGRLVSKTPPAPAPVVSYAYDRAGRPTVFADTSATIAAAVPPPPGTPVRYATNWTYDRLNRLVGTVWDNAAAAGTLPASGGVTFTHAYNAVNQRVGQTTTDDAWWNVPSAAAAVAYAANPADQYTAVGVVTPSYDANGNLTSDGSYTYGYDAENRLVSVAQGGTTVASYAYDARGRRKLRIAGGVTTLFVTDAEGRELLEYRGDGALLRWYAYGAGRNDVLAQMEVAAPATRTTYVPDILGSVVAGYASDSGARTLRRYRPYGEGLGGGGFAFAFTGQRLDAEAGGLQYFRARHYHPGLGRFLQADPIGYDGGNNLYAYVGNDPLNATDPEGLALQQMGSATWDLITPGGQASLQALAEFQQGNYGSAALQFSAGVVEAGLTVGTAGLGFGASIARRASGYAASAVGALRGGAASAAESAGPAAATGFRGSRGFELTQPVYQEIRNLPGEVNGRAYSRHAFDQMQNRGIVPSVVDNTIANGVTFPTRSGTIGYFDAVNRVRVIVNSDTGQVVTVIRGGP